METLFPPLCPDDVRRMGTLELAYFGDTVCDLFVRHSLVGRGMSVRQMHRQAVALVNAQAQADAVERIRPMLNEDEAEVLRRGQNAKAHHAAPRGVDPRTYQLATAFEVLLGHLYLTGQAERLEQLMRAALEDQHE